MWEIADSLHPERAGPRYLTLTEASRVAARANGSDPRCGHCGRAIEQDDAPDGPWFHPGTMTARCDGPDDPDEAGGPLYWSDMVRQADPRFYLRWLGTESPERR